MCVQSLQSFLIPWPHGAHQAPWDSPGKYTGVGHHALLQGIFSTQGSNSHPLPLLCWQEDPLLLACLGSWKPTCVFCISTESHGFSGCSAGKESACNAGALGSIPGLGRSPGEGNGYPLQYSGLENSMDSVVLTVAKSWTWLSNFHFYFIFL